MSNYYIDTSSWITVARYYAPFDKDAVLKSFLEEKLSTGQIILIDSVYQECLNTTQGLVTETYSFLKEHREKSVKIAFVKDQNRLDNNWCVPSQKRKLSESDYELQKIQYIGSADFQLIAHVRDDEGSILITEETSSPNDNKLFKKIPTICSQENIACKNIVEFLKAFECEIDYKIESSDGFEYML